MNVFLSSRSVEPYASNGRKIFSRISPRLRRQPELHRNLSFSNWSSPVSPEFANEYVSDEHEWRKMVSRVQVTLVTQTCEVNY